MKHLSLDARRDTKRQREAFSKIRNAEKAYARQLRKIAKHIEDAISGFDLTTPFSTDTLQKLLQQYSALITPWAKSVAARMLADVKSRDEKAWFQYARFMGISLHEQIRNAPLGAEIARLLDEQVSLITSLPLVAAKRVHEIATGQLYTGQRWEQLAKEILNTGQVTKSRANLIARTETTRAATTLTQVRASSIGSEGYIWRTMLDSDVRKLHKKLEGSFHRWDDPPIAGEKGERAHPGGIYNCRCFPEPVLPEKF